MKDVRRRKNNNLRVYLPLTNIIHLPKRFLVLVPEDLFLYFYPVCFTAV
jgi:hypothetical protein